MRMLRHRLAVLVAVCCVLGACSDDKPAKTASTSGTSDASAESSDVPTGATSAEATDAPAVGGDADCTALKDSLASIFIKWQVVIGLTNSASSEWGQIPIGTIAQFGDQLAVATAALGSDPDAAGALAFMSGANDIVARGLGGDAAAQADLTTYLGTDTVANIGKQLPISLAYENVGCK
jgi:hypothetical protein